MSNPDLLVVLTRADNGWHYDVSGETEVTGVHEDKGGKLELVVIGVGEDDVWRVTVERFLDTPVTLGAKGEP